MNARMEDDWRTITSKFENSKCSVCGGIITQGAQVLWKKGSGIKHIEKCGEMLEEMPEEQPIKITDKEWRDFNKYNMETLQKITNCQCCGTSVANQPDNYYNDDRRVCRKCFRI